MNAYAIAKILSDQKTFEKLTYFHMDPRQIEKPFFSKVQCRNETYVEKQEPTKTNP